MCVCVWLSPIGVSRYMVAIRCAFDIGLSSAWKPDDWCGCASSVSLLEIACIDLHQTGSVGESSDHLQLIKFWPSCAPGKGVCGGAKIFGSTLLQPTRSVCVSPSAFYAALLPRRGPHYASHSVCPSVCPSVPLSLPSVTSRHLANYNDTHVLFGTLWGPHIVRPSRPHRFLFGFCRCSPTFGLWRGSTLADAVRCLIVVY